MLEIKNMDGKYVLPRKPTVEECGALNLDFEDEMRDHKRTVERIYKRNSADKRAEKRAQEKQQRITITYTSVDDWILRAVEPYQAKSRLAHPDKLPGYPNAPQPEHCASTEVHSAIQARQAELYREFRRERLKFQGKDAYARQLARAASATAAAAADADVGAAAPSAQSDDDFQADDDVGAAAAAQADDHVGAAAPAQADDDDFQADDAADDDVSDAGAKRKHDIDDDAAAKRQRVYKERTVLQKAVGKQNNAKRAAIIAENRRKWQKENYSKRAEKNKAYLKIWRKSEHGKEISAYHHEKANSGVVKLSSGAVKRGYTQSLHADQVAALCAMPCIYCGVTESVNIDRVVNTEDYSMDNCVPCCTICNHMKSDLHLDTFIAHRERIVNFQMDRIIVPADEDGSFKRVFLKYRTSAMRRGIDWSLDTDQFERLTRLFSSCFYCGDSANFMGIDRKDNHVGYTVTNAVSCCKLCNYFKCDLSVEAFLEKCRRGVDWVKLHPIDVARSEMPRTMPSREQMSTTLVVHSTQDARKIRKPLPEISPDAPVYFLKSFGIKKFHLYLDCGGGRESASQKWQTFATQTIPRRLVPAGVTLCLSCVNARSSLHAPAPAVTFTSDAAALEWLRSASSAFSKRHIVCRETEE